MPRDEGGTSCYNAFTLSVSFFLSSVNAFPFLYTQEHLFPICNKTRLFNSLLDLVAF